MMRLSNKREASSVKNVYVFREDKRRTPELPPEDS